MLVENCLPALFCFICGYTADHSFTPIISSTVILVLRLSVIVENYQVKFSLSEVNQLNSIP